MQTHFVSHFQAWKAGTRTKLVHRLSLCYLGDTRTELFFTLVKVCFSKRCRWRSQSCVQLSFSHLVVFSAAQVSEKKLTCEEATKLFTFAATGKWNPSAHPLLVSEINLPVIFLLQIGSVFKTNSLWPNLHSFCRKFIPQGCQHCR